MADIVTSRTLDRHEFDRKYRESKTPVVVDGEADDWKATTKWTPEYLDCVLGHQETRVSYRDDGITGANFETETELVPFTEARQRIEEDGRNYVSQMSIERPWVSRRVTGDDVDFPQLADDIRQPRFLDNPSKFHFVTMLWFGGDRCKSGLHWDVFNNFFIQISGKKRFLLFSPSQTEYLYPEYGTRYPHTARVNVFDPDEDDFPRYERAESVELTVEPGDMLFIPTGWWHATDSLTTSISVNFWWLGPDAYVRYLLEMLTDMVGVDTPNLIKLPSDLRM